MITLHSLADFPKDLRSVVTLGTFDGVHEGHRAILARLMEAAKKTDAVSVVLTFYPHPRSVVEHATAVQWLNTLEEKEQLLADLGIDYLIVLPFTPAFSQQSAEEFVLNYLVNGLHIQQIIIGHDHRFGKNRSANFDDLVLFGQKYQFDVEQITAQEIEAVAVSSTKVRNQLLAGDVAQAKRLLGGAYMLKGLVVHGKQLGRTIGFPTANLQWNNADKLLPQQGVYVVEVEALGKRYRGMLNIGNNPTVDGTGWHVEVHLLNFTGDLYGQWVTVWFCERLRDEMKFQSVEALKTQLALDRIQAEHYSA
ncbi:MAG: riboflavin biosynthesis protein RibF [Flavobacterium sp. BFFFF2]|nr:MAG: riboflavin biosynthesis protein RibF [Flavobacterium sp. BFFFF2]